MIMAADIKKGMAQQIFHRHKDHFRFVGKNLNAGISHDCMIWDGENWVEDDKSNLSLIVSSNIQNLFMAAGELEQIHQYEIEPNPGAVQLQKLIIKSAKSLDTDYGMSLIKAEVKRIFKDSGLNVNLPGEFLNKKEIKRFKAKKASDLFKEPTLHKRAWRDLQGIKYILDQEYLMFHPYIALLVNSKARSALKNLEAADV